MTGSAEPADHVDPGGLQPVDQTRDAFGLLVGLGNGDVEASLLGMARRVRTVSPECMAMSLTLWQSGLTFTLVGDRRAAGLMDAVQYLDGGPCVEAVTIAEPVVTDLGPAAVDEDRWQLFARAGSRLGIGSTLSLPVLGDDGEVIAGINLYGGTRDTFDGQHEELAQVCGAWAAGIVTNADLGFESRVRAAAAPDRLVESREIDLAAGLVAAKQVIDGEEAARRMASAADRAGVSTIEFARFVLDAHAAEVEGR